jgi:Ca-activated chloride channel family protein
MLRRLRAVLGLCASIAVAACGGSSGDGSSASGSGSSGGDESNTLRVIGGSELKDLEPLFDRIAKGSGVHLQMTYAGTLAGVDRLKAGESFDAAWFANAKYLLLNDTKHRVRAQERIMLSPVIFGVKESVAKKFGWTTNGTSWKDLSARAGSGQFRFAMTNPASSNSGFSATIAVASAFAGTGDVLRPSDVDVAKLKAFFKGQTLTSGSSGWLTDSYVRDQDTLDGIVNYEASLIALNASGKLHEKLALIYPKEGTITADYPLLLLDDAKRPLYDKLVAYLKSDEFQQHVMNDTERRPVDPNVKLGPEFPTALVNEIAFPNSLGAVDGILESYLNENRIPAHAFYVLDTSGSMQGERIDGVRKALYTLANGDASLTGKFARFQNREKISLISFSSDVTAPVDLEMHSATDPATLTAVRKYADALDADGSTAIYCALEAALSDAAKAAKGESRHYSSIVLMTDGENNRCDSETEFERKYRALPVAQRIKIFPIRFGEGDAGELQDLATLTGGRVFDGTSESLAQVFKEIRGYQ